MLEWGTDGDTLGHEGQEKSGPYRIRHIPKDAVNAPFDLLALMHPKSPFDIESLAGKRTPHPPPPGWLRTHPPPPGCLRTHLQPPGWLPTHLQQPGLLRTHLQQPGRLITPLQQPRVRPSQQQQ